MKWNDDRETVLQVALLMALVWALCWMFNQWGGMDSLPPIGAEELKTARTRLMGESPQ